MIHKISIERLPDNPKPKKGGISVSGSLQSQPAKQVLTQTVSGISTSVEVTPCIPCQKKKKRNK